MKYLLDTNIIVDHLRGVELIDSRLTEEGSAISIITFSELLYGACKSLHQARSRKAVQDLLSLLNLRIEPISEEVAQEFAEMKAILERAGQRLEDFDLLIAATAKVFGLILVTRNIKHFERVEGLRLYKWEK